jgi:glycosyltransferase involved in cell wall biosynthesis
MKPVGETVIENRAWAGAAPVLSVLIPFLRDDPRRLLAALDREAADVAGGVEIVVLDDGGDDDDLAENLAEMLADLRLPARFVRLSANLGRAKGRNRLAGHARGGFLLFLDADMLPDHDRFLGAYLEVIAEAPPAVAFGGFSLDQAPLRREHALHRRMALGSDCLPARSRRLKPEKYVFTSNLLVRRDVFTADPFDEGFSGWGWEDVEWAMRASRRHAIAHLDNTATHLGLDTAPAMAAKYEQSAANFARVAAHHPEIVAGYPSYRVARLLKRVPLLRLWRSMFRFVALSEAAPVAPRAFAMRLYRAALYAEAL